MNTKRNVRGFTLIEILIVFGVLGILGGVSSLVYGALRANNNIQDAQHTIGQALRRAQLLSQTNKGDSLWGIKIETEQVTIFKGINYASRDIVADEIIDLPLHITVIGIDEITFSKLSGFPQLSGVIEISTNYETAGININEKGLVSY